MEITDEKIFKIALITSFIGIIGLILFSGYIEPKEIKISEIDQSHINEKICVIGVIEDIEYSSNSKTCFLTINDGTGKINAIMFESALNNFKEDGTNPKIFKNQKVKLTGTLTEYKSSIELILENSNSIKIYY